MESTTPFPSGPGQRMLAAIVFTDIVGFSARMQEDEEGTLRLLEGDFKFMREMAGRHDGSVLKTTGDGLLLYFTSAVQAVGYAQNVQRRFAARAKNEPDDEILVHRIGVHLGDVFVHDQDVMGDGVNIAARLQAEAEPGGICISQTVYEVVKNKLELAVVKLAPRELKNISQEIPMYHVRLESPKPGGPGPAPAGRIAPIPAAPLARAPRGWRIPALTLVVLALAAGGALVWRAHLRQQDELARSRETRKEIGARLGERTAAATVLPAPPAPPEEIDFVALTRDQAEGGPGSAPESAQLREHANKRLQDLVRWIDGAMLRYNQDSPLLVRELPGMISTETKVFSDADHRVYFAEGGAIRQRTWAELKPAVFGAVILSLLLDAPTPPPREAVQGAEAFAYLYGLPQLNEALRAGRLAGTRK